MNNLSLSLKEKRLAVIMATLFVVGVFGPTFGFNYATTTLNQKAQQKNQLDKEIVDLRNKLSGIEDEREAVRANREDYINWVEKGVVGEQDPVVWVKEMKNIASQRNLFPVSYNFAEEILQPPTVSPFTTDSTVQIRLWDMTMQMAMLHDLDALMFLGSLKSRVDSFFFPVECEFALLEPEFSLISRQNLSANCRLTWVSVEDPEYINKAES